MYSLSFYAKIMLSQKSFEQITDLHFLLYCVHKHYTNGRLAPTWQYFGTITCDGLHGIMKLYIDKP